MDRRGFFGALLGAAVAPIAAAVSPAPRRLMAGRFVFPTRLFGPRDTFGLRTWSGVADRPLASLSPEQLVAWRRVTSPLVEVSGLVGGEEVGAGGLVADVCDVQDGLVDKGLTVRADQTCVFAENGPGDLGDNVRTGLAVAHGHGGEALTQEETDQEFQGDASRRQPVDGVAHRPQLFVVHPMPPVRSRAAPAEAESAGVSKGSGLWSDAHFPLLDGKSLGPAPTEAFRRVRERTGLGYFVSQRLLWGAMGETDLSQTPWAKFDEVWA